MRSTLLGLTAVCSVASFVGAQTFSSSDSNYTGYSLGVSGDDDSTLYETDETSTSNSSYPPPDVYLNASVSVGEIDIVVQNLTAKINLDATVLNLLSFNAGVNVSIERVDLLIQNITAKVLLEARLGNLVTMISDVLDSIDLNPVIATLGSGLEDVASDVGSVVNSTVSDVGSTLSNLTARSYDVNQNILYSVNDYSGNTHTNRILDQDGNIIERYLDNNGNVKGQKTVGSYSQDMTFAGHEVETTVGGVAATLREYLYTPFPGLLVISAIYTNSADNVVAAQVLSESGGGGSSTISN